MSSLQEAVATAYDWLSVSSGPALPASLKKARTAFRRECGSWLSHSSILGFGIGEKEAQGVCTGEPALQIFVEKKLQSRHVQEEMIPSIVLLPHSRTPVLLDVVEQSAGETFGTALAGDGVRLNDSTIGPGTIGCFAKAKSRVRRRATYGITCWHVAAAGRISGSAVRWCEDPEGRLPNLRFGTLDRYLSPVRKDATGTVRDIAVVKIYGDLSVTNRTPGGYPIRGVRTNGLRRGTLLKAFGFGSKSVRAGQVLNPKATVVVRYSEHGPIRFDNAVLTTGMSIPGDSGLIAVDDEDRAVGMLIGGQHGLERDWSLFVPIAPLLDHFNLELIGSGEVSDPHVGHTASDIDTVARTIWGEAEGEPMLGKVAVANVIANRVAANLPRRFGRGFSGVCKKRSRNVCQFSCWTDSSDRKARAERISTRSPIFRTCLDIAAKTVRGLLEDVTSGSDHYHATNVSPSWSAGHTPVLRVGAHAFFNDIS